MDQSRLPWGRYLLVAALGAVVGGIAVVLTSRAIPNLVSGIMSSMMGRMMAQMGSEGCDPEDMCRRMAKAFAEAHTEAGIGPRTAASGHEEVA